MKVISIAIFSFLLLLQSSHAQVRRCTGADGKVTYSDVVCKSTLDNERSVKINQNTIDGSGMRQDLQQQKSQVAIEQAMQKSAHLCKFSYFVYGDNKGKALSDAAKSECLENITAKATGRPITLEAYQMWKDHSNSKSADRRASIAQANAAEIARSAATSNSNAAINAQNKTYECKPNALGSALNCR